MKKNLTKKLMLSVLTLAFAVVSLGASTFAWFTVGGTQQTASFDANVVGGIGLDVAVTECGDAPSQWFSAGADINDEIETVLTALNEQADWSFNAITPAAKLAYGANAFKTQTEALEAQETSKGKGYVAFDIHFKLSDNTISDVYELMIKEFKITTADITAWKCDVQFDVAEGKTIALNTPNEYNVMSALRFAVIENGTDGFYKIYEQDAVDNFASGKVSNGYNTTGFSAADKGAVAYYEAKTTQNVTVAADKQDATKYERLAFDSNTIGQQNVIVNDEFTGNDQVISLTILLWVEGWDAECLNAIFSQNIKLDLAFALSKGGVVVE